MGSNCHILISLLSHLFISFPTKDEFLVVCAFQALAPDVLHSLSGFLSSMHSPTSSFKEYFIAITRLDCSQGGLQLGLCLCPASPPPPSPPCDHLHSPSLVLNKKENILFSHPHLSCSTCVVSGQRSPPRYLFDQTSNINQNGQFRQEKVLQLKAGCSKL